MIYQTRRMVAMQEMRHEKRNLSAGQEFEATENDARYLEKIGRAKFVMEQVAALHSEQQPIPRRRGRPPKVQQQFQEPQEQAQSGNDTEIE
jgi:hypothetical protein